MPWKSKKQQRWGHGRGGKKAGFSQDKIEEWDEKTNFESLPEEALIDEAATKDDVKGLKKLSREHNMGMRSGGFHSPQKGKKQYTRKEKHKDQSKSETLTPTDETYRGYSFPLAELAAGLHWSTAETCNCRPRGICHSTFKWKQETHSDDGYVPAWGFHSVVDRGVDPHEKHEGARKIEQTPSPLPASGSGKKLHKAHALNWETEGQAKVWSSTLSWEVLAYGHGGYHYNPHVSKPVALEPIGEEGGYHYFGPPPDGGFSYGLYTDGTNTIAAQRASQVYSPITGTPMKYAGDASYDTVKQALSGSKFPNLLHSCGSCAYAYVTSADYLKSLNCPACGSSSDYGNALMRGRRAAKK